MAIVKKIEDFPGYKTAKQWYDKLPGNGIIKAIVVGAVVGFVGAAIVGGVIAGALALVPLVGALLAAPLLVQIGVIITLVAVFGLLVRVVSTLYNFNWNMTDSAIDNQIKTAYDAVFSTVGEALGSALGYLVCGGLPGMVAFAFSPAVAALVIADLKAEAVEQLFNNLSIIANGVFAISIGVLALKSFKSARKYLKRPGNPFYNLLVKQIGKKNLDNWGKEGSDPLVFSQKVEDKIENIKDAKLKNFVEGLYEGFFEGCVEAGYIVSNRVQDSIAANALANRKAGVGAGESVVELDLNPTT